MPIYEYACLDCQHEFEVLRPMAQADASQTCQLCGGQKIKRKLSAFFAQSGGKAVAGTSEPSCGSCSSTNCANCEH